MMPGEPKGVGAGTGGSPGEEEERDLQSLTSFLQCLSPASSTTSPKASRSPSPASLPALSPTFSRRRLFHFRSRNVEGLLGSSPPVRGVLRLARDAVQPASGSISDVHSEASVDEEDEEGDFFSLDAPMRPRARTCPEHRSWQRRARVRNMRRPPTPPPADADALDVDKHFSRLMVKDKLRIPSRDLPEVPETGQMIGDMDT